MGVMLTGGVAASARSADRSPVRVAADLKPGPPYVRTLLKSGVAWGLLVSGLVSIWVLLWLHGLDYYLTPVTRRGYVPSHAALRPSAPFGQAFGMIGTVLMLVPFLYMLRKRLGKRSGVGTTKGWLEVHLFCGIVGPVLVTFHTAFKFNGIVSAAYWAMASVMLSGFVGRYLYVRIPRSLRGTELTRSELDTRADRLHTELLTTAGGGVLLDRIGRLEQAAAPAETGLSWFGLLFGEIGVRRKLTQLRRDVERSTLSGGQRDALMELATERVLLLRRIAYLQRTKTAFGLWHVFHLPLVYLMLVIAVIHITVVTYLGYVALPW